MQLSQLRMNLKRIDFQSLVGDALQAQKKEIVEYQKAQMLHGQRADGLKIGKYKDYNYARVKANMNPIAGYGFVDLKYRGEFQRNIGIRFFADSYVLFSSDSKADALLLKYGPDIFGLNAEFIKDFATMYLNSELNKQIRKQIYGL